jgi:hypothetical protein
MFAAEEKRALSPEAFLDSLYAWPAGFVRTPKILQAIAAFSLASEGRKRAPRGEGQLKMSEVF